MVSRIESPHMPIDASNRPDDLFGYSVYAGVLFAPAQLAEPVDAVRVRVGSPRAALPAHVTVMGTFCDVKSLRGVQNAFDRAVKGHGPVKVTFDGEGLNIHPTWAGFNAVKSAELASLYASFVQAVGPLVTDAYGYAEHGYTPHLTVWQECPPDKAQLAEQLGRPLNMGGGFVANAVVLVARRGTAYGGRWATVGLFPLRA